MTKVLMPTELVALARLQGGVFTTKQAAQAGITRAVTQRYLDDHVLWSLTRGLYSLSPDPAWKGLAWGGVLLGGPGAALGRAAAGHELGLCPAPEIIDVLTPRNRRDRGPWRFHRTQAINPRGDLPLGEVEQTALAICAAASPSTLFDHLAVAVSSRRTTPQRLLNAALASPNLRHRGLICEALDDVAQGVHSALERRYLRDVEQRHRLPAGARQAQLLASRYFDVTYDDGVVVELDGRLGHDGAGIWRDFERDNANALRGRVTLRFGWKDVAARPCAVAAAVAELLRSRGWDGALARCPACS